MTRHLLIMCAPAAALVALMVVVSLAACTVVPTEGPGAQPTPKPSAAAPPHPPT